MGKTMANPVWPDKSVNFRSIAEGVECTMRTSVDGVDLSVSEVADDNSQAEKAAKRAIDKKARQRIGYRK